MVRNTLDSFAVSELVAIFRSSMLALLPSMAQARIRWRAEEAYDPWENIQTALFSSIVGSCVENAATGALFPLAPYDLRLGSYKKNTFLTVSGRSDMVFLRLDTKGEPFDEAVFLQIDENFLSTKETSQIPLADVDFRIALCAQPSGTIQFSDRIAYHT